MSKKMSPAESVLRKVTTEDTYTGTYKGNLFISKISENASEAEKEF